MEIHSSMVVKLYTPYPHQKAVHDAISEHIRTHKRFTEPFQKVFVVKACRQVGKSALTENELLRFALTMTGSVSGYVAPSFSLCRKVFDELCGMLSVTSLVASRNASTLVIKLTNGSEIKCFSGEQRDNLRGNTISGLLVIDEAAFIPDKIYNDAIAPWTDAKKAVTLMISSPDFEMGFFYDHYVLGLKGDKPIASFDFMDYDLTMVRSEKRLEQLRATVPAQTFRSEYLGLFKKAEGSVFGDFKGCVLQHEAETPTEMFWGLDFATGSGKDYTVLTAFNQNREQCFLWRTNDMQPIAQVNHIVSILEKYRDVTRGIVAEQNSIGKIYLDMLRGRSREIIRFNTDMHTKRKIVELLQVAIQNGDVFFLNDRELLAELSFYEAKVNHNTKNVSYNAPAGLNDDCVMATMLANFCYDKRKNVKSRIKVL